MSSLGVRGSPVQKMEPPKANGIPPGKFETSSDDNYSDATEQEAPAFHDKSNVHCQRGENCQVHVWCVGSLQAETAEHGCNQQEIGKHGDIYMLPRFCPNRRRINDMQKLFGQLCRVCVLGDAKWSVKTQTRACNYVQPVYRSGNNVDERSMHILPEASARVGSEGLGGSLPMLVDTFVDESVRRNIASSIRCDLPTNSRDPKEFSENYEWVAEYGFNHIIVIGEMLSGLLFLDCYGRVFQWENMQQVLWPIGDSLENLKLYKDLEIWIVEEDGIVYKESKDIVNPFKNRKKNYF